MEFAATQIYEDDHLPTQKIPCTIKEKELIQIGTLNIDSNEYQIKEGITKIGRVDTCDIVINDMTVSKTHAEIEATRNKESSIWICDLNSSNKTMLGDIILRPDRLYEVRDGSIIKFGRVHATYRAYRPMVIPETPAPSRRRITSTIIPSTPDSSLNNSSSDDGSIIFGTQKDKQNSVFLRPQIPQQRQSVNIDKKNTSYANSSSNESDGLQTITELHASNTDISENHESSNIFDVETQKLEEHGKMISNSIHDIETQIISTDTSTHFIQADTKANKQTKLNVQDEIASTSAIDIHDMETQHYESYIKELETQKSKDNIWNVTLKKLATDICNVETQNYIDDINKDTKKSELDKNKSQKKNLDQIECDINDLETQKFNNKDIAEDISNIETQPELNATRKILNVESQLKISDIVNDINNDRTTDKDNTKTVNRNNDDNEKDKDNTIDTIKTKINYDNVAQSPKSRSSSPGSLNLSSPGVDEDCLSLSQHSDHLLESSDLLEYFGEGIDKRETIAPNTSTPKSHAKTSSERDNNVENVSNCDEDNIFDALTQRVHEFEEKSNEINEKDIICKKKRESKETIDNPKMHIEEYPEKFAKKQCKFSEISDKSSDNNIDNRNDPGTSIESEDLFEALTQQSNSSAVNNILNSSVNQLSKINTVVDDMAPTQIINNDKNTYNQDNMINKPLTDNNAIEDEQEKHISCKKSGESFQEIDSVEQKLHEMFDNINNSIHEPTHMSTQALEDILESPQDNNLSTNAESESLLRDNISQTQLEKTNRAACDQFSRELTDTETNNVNNAEIDSQNSDTYFSTLTTKRKRNILKETQELVEPVLQNVIPSRRDSNTSLISEIKEKKTEVNTSTESNKRRKKISRLRNESDSMIDVGKNDDNVIETISNGNNEKNLRSSMKRKLAAASKTDKRVLRNNPNKVKVDDVEKHSESESDVCVPCPSADAERTQTSDTHDSDDDILTRLPAVRISGTLSNPASSSTTSTLTECSARSKQDIENSKKDEVHDKLSVSLCDNDVPGCNSPKTKKVTTQLIDTSEESDNEANFKRFKQMADRLNNELDCLKQHDKQNKSNKKKSVPFSPNLSEDLKQDTDDELKSSSQTTSRVTRHSNKQNDESLDVSCKEARMEKTTYNKSTKPEMRSIVTRRKRTLSTIEKDTEQMNLRKRKAHQIIEERPILTRARRNMKTAIDRQSPNILDYFTKTSSRENSPVIGNTKSSQDNKTIPETEESEKVLNLKADKSVNSGRSNIKRTAKENSNNNQQVQAQEEQIKLNQSQHKSLKIVLSPIKNLIISPIDNESQEVEMIMRKSLNDVQDKNVSIRETNTAKIFQRKLRIRNKKQLNADTETDSPLTDSNTSSIDDSNTQSDNFTSKVKSRKRFTKSSTAKAQALEKKETFKKPTRINQNSTNSVFDSSSENTNSESSQNSIESDILSNSRSSRSKTAGARRNEKIEMTRNMHRMVNESVSSINTSIEVTSLLSTPSTRMRRSASVLNTTLSVAGHRILFTGITEDYSKIVKTLGGNKVEDLAKCNVLVTDKVRRTYKFLCALAQGIPIVTIDWLRDSESAAQFLDWKGYILKDPAAEAKFGFRLRKSLDKAKEKKLLDGYTIILTPNIAPPPIQELKDMIMSCGGKALLRPPSKWPEKAMIISREEDLSSARKFLAKAPKTVTIQSTEFILTGILRQEMDFDKYRIM